MNSTENSNLLLVHRSMDVLAEQSAEADIVITPQFYTLKREKLPVKYVYQAKRIAPSLFEGLIDHEEERDYFVYREGEDWILIAFDPARLLSFLKGQGVIRIGKVFFAQQMASRLKGAIRLGEKEALTTLDGIVTVVPVSGLQTEDFVPLSSQLLPKKGMRLSGAGGSVLTALQTYLLVAVLLLFGILWITEGVRYTKGNDDLQAVRSAYYAQYPSMKNGYSRENILQKYRKIDRQERKKRNIVSKIASILSKKVILTRLTIDKQKYRATFKILDASLQKRVQQMLKQSGLQIIRASENEITVGGLL